jgi:hypothetical protein
MHNIEYKVGIILRINVNEFLFFEVEFYRFKALIALYFLGTGLRYFQKKSRCL